MHILLLGATGFSGKEVLRQLLQTQHTITVITRMPQQIGINNELLHVLEGNVLNQAFMNKVLAGKDAVINCLGIGGKGNGKQNTLLSDATHILIQSMHKNKVSRLIAMSNIGAGDSEHFHPWVFRKIILPYFMPWLQTIIEDKNRLEPLIQQSGLDWTIVRLPNINDKPAKKHIHTTLDGKGLKLSITNEDTAQFLVQQLTDIKFVHQTPSISN